MTGGNGDLARMADLIDRVIADPAARETARLELFRLAETQARGGAGSAEWTAADAQSADGWTRRARPTFLYVMYALLLGAIPLGLVAALSPTTARDIVAGMSAYLAAIPEPLYALFGTGYLGYTLAREWGKGRAG